MLYIIVQKYGVGKIFFASVSKTYSQRLPYNAVKTEILWNIIHHFSWFFLMNKILKIVFIWT